MSPSASSRRGDESMGKSASTPQRITFTDHEPQRHRGTEVNLFLCVSESLWPVIVEVVGVLQCLRVCMVRRAVDGMYCSASPATSPRGSKRTGHVKSFSI